VSGWESSVGMTHAEGSAQSRRLQLGPEWSVS